MKRNILSKIAYWSVYLLFVFSLSALAQKLVWLKPIESDLKMEGSRITEGAALDLMKFVASHIENVEHEFHAYPVKRSWHLIKRQINSNEVFCFWGADYKKEREEWGIFTQPASITLPFMVATRKSELSSYASNGEIEATKLLSQGYSTVVYDKVINPWTKIIDKVENKVLVKISGINRDLSDHTLLMILRKRIDFGYISHRAIANLNLYNHAGIDLYEIKEMNQVIEKDSRMLCSKTPLGKLYSEQINSALFRIQDNSQLNQKLRDLTFRSEGYPEGLRLRFNKHWNNAFPVLR